MGNYHKIQSTYGITIKSLKLNKAYKNSYVVIISIKIHGSVLCSPRSPGRVQMGMSIMNHGSGS